MAAQVFQNFVYTAGVEGLAVVGKIAGQYGACTVTHGLAGLGKIHTLILTYVLYPVVGIAYHDGGQIVGGMTIRTVPEDFEITEYFKKDFLFM